MVLGVAGGDKEQITARWLGEGRGTHVRRSEHGAPGSV